MSISSSYPMCSVHFTGQGVHRPVSIDTLDVLDAFDLTGLDVLDGKLDGNWTQAVRRDYSLKTGSENPHFGDKFLRKLRQGCCDFHRRIDRRVMYSMVACKRLIRNVVNATATALLPLLGPACVLPRVTR